MDDVQGCCDRVNAPALEHPTHTDLHAPSTNGTAVFYPQSAADDAFVEELIAYWLSFVRSGSPNTFKLARAPEWPLYHQSTTQRMVLTEGTTTETGSAVETIPSVEVERCAFVATKANAEQA